MSAPANTPSKPRAHRQKVDFPPLSRRPISLCYDTDFAANNRNYPAGVYYHGVKPSKDSDDDGGVPTDQLICSVLKVISVVRSSTGNEHSYLIEYVAHGETEPRKTLLPQAILLGRADESLKALRSLGVSVLRSTAKLVADYLDKEHLRFSSQRPQDFWQSVQATGWAPYPTCFALPYKVLHNGSGPGGVWYAGNTQDVIFSCKGTLENWKDKVAALCEENSFLVLAVCTALSGPLLEPLNIQGIGFHINGDSSSGKSTIQYTGVSVWGPRKSLRDWHLTANALEAHAAIRSSTFLALDESHQVDPKTLDSSVYMLLNGGGKGRLSRDLALRPAAAWRISVLSSGENAIETHLTAAKIDHKAGQAVRMIDLSVCGKYGLFDDIKERKDAAAFSDEIQRAAAAVYGHAGPAFVQHLIEEHETINLASELAGIMQKFEEGEALTAQEKRVARSFAIVALAGELAGRWKILPWQKGHATTAAHELFGIWRTAQPQAPHGMETAQILNRITKFIDNHGNSRFLDIHWVKPGDYSDDSPKVHNQAGYFEHDKQGGKIYLFTSSGLQEAIGNFTINRAVQAVQAVGGFTETDAAGGKTPKSRRVPEGGTKRLYHIDPEALLQK